jgi:carboxypeptidase Taq
MGEKVEQLKQHLYPYHDLQKATAVLGWDREVNMPPGGSDARAEQSATLNAMAHEIFTSDETGKLLETAEAEVEDAAYDGDDASYVRVLRREYDKQVKIPTELVAEFSRVRSHAFVAWREARQNDDYPHFQPHLAKIVEINCKIADILGYDEHPYDALIDFYEPDMTAAKVETVFTELKEGLVPLVEQIVEDGQPVDDSFFGEQAYPVDKQWDLTEAALRDIGYDFSCGRQDKAPHPFTTHFSCNDVRVTTRLLENRPQSAFFSSVHEGGHALYEQGIPEKFERTVLSGGATLGLHESQSRMWENMLGRSRAFWSHYLPIMRAFFPEQLAGISFEDFYRAINKVSPSLIRVEADEVTYHMHIFARFEIELALVTGELDVADVPDAWNAKYEDYLGITPPSDADGCLQDVHWSHGTIGYFPTYTLGTIMSAQFYRRAKLDVPALEEQIAAGNFLSLLEWARKHIHKHGSKFTADELLERELGEDLDAQPLLAYLTTKYTDIYEL